MPPAGTKDSRGEDSRGEDKGDAGSSAAAAGSASATPAISSGMSSPHIEKNEKGTKDETEGDGILWPSERELNRGIDTPDRRAYKAPDFEGRRK